MGKYIIENINIIQKSHTGILDYLAANIHSTSPEQTTLQQIFTLHLLLHGVWAWPWISFGLRNVGGSNVLNAGRSSSSEQKLSEADSLVTPHVCVAWPCLMLALLLQPGVQNERHAKQTCTKLWIQPKPHLAKFQLASFWTWNKCLTINLWDFEVVCYTAKLTNIPTFQWRFYICVCVSEYMCVRTQAYIYTCILAYFLPDIHCFLVFLSMCVYMRYICLRGCIGCINALCVYIGIQ